MPTWVALLRAVNLGSRNKVSMPVLRERLAEAGFDNVRTYVNSGNVVVDSRLRSPAKVAAAVRGIVAEHFGVDTPVVVRTGGQLAEVLAWNPFPEAAAERPKHVMVVHLAEEPEPDRVAEALAVDVSPDQVAVRGPEAVIAYAVSAQGSPRVDTALRRLKVDGTARNWRTLTALVDLARS